MRCPKCGFISFDHLETCKKCHKYIGDIIGEINGTTYEAEAPRYLSVTSADRSAPPRFVQPAEEKDAATLFADEKEFELEEPTEKEFTLDQEFEPAPQRNEIEFPGGETDLVMELDDIAEISPRDEFTLDLGEQPQEMQPPLPAMDFGDLDISDLAPPVQEQPEGIRFEEPSVLSDLEPIATLSPPPPPSPSPAQNPLGLEDLNFNGLDLDTPAKLVSGSAAGKRFLPSVKTGTALDKFDIDLGELFTDNKK